MSHVEYFLLIVGDLNAETSEVLFEPAGNDRKSC